jgi:D-aspartate ligase
MSINYRNLEQPCAIIVGLDSLQGLQTARVLDQRNVPVIAIAKDHKYHSCRTKVCEEIIFANTENEELIEALMSLGPKLGRKAVIFPCQDNNVLNVSRHRHAIEEWYHIALPPHDIVEMLMDKAGFCSYAQMEGFPIPRTFILKTRTDAEIAAQKSDYPCILKPSIRNPNWLEYTSLKAFKVSNADELLEVYDRFEKLADVMIAQQWIEGGDTNHYTCHCYFDANSNPIVTFTSRKLRQWPPQTGQRCLGQECRDDSVMEQTLRLYRSVNHRGLGYIEMKRDERSGEYFMLEANVGRPTGTSTNAEAGGVEILYTMYCDCVGLPLPENIKQKYTGVKWIHLLRDIQASSYHWRHGDLSLSEWWRSWRGPKTYALLSWRDPLPFLSAVRRSLFMMLSPKDRQHESITPTRRDGKRHTAEYARIIKPKSEFTRRTRFSDMNLNESRILMLTESAFPNDTRVRNEAYALVNAGYKVSVIALRRYDYEKPKETVNGVNVYRIPEVALFKKSESRKSWFRTQLYRIKSALGYIFEYVYFTIACFLVSLYLAIKEKFDVVHLHNPPNTLLVIGVFYRLFGKKFVFDHHDLEPELYLSRYGIETSLIYKVLLLEERLCLKSANIVIATNESYKEIEIKRGNLKPEKIFVVRNGPDLKTFRPVAGDEELQNMSKKILVYIGVMGPQDGVDHLLRSLSQLVYSMGRTDFYCVIIGRGDAVEDLKALRDELRLQDYVRFTGRIPIEDLMRYLSTADICLDPNPSNPLNDSSTWIKVMEYMAFAKPIVSFDLKETRYSAQKAAIYVTPNDEEEYAKTIARLMDNPDERKKMGAYGQKRVKNKLAWQHVSKNLLLAYETLLPKPSKELCSTETLRNSTILN